MPTKIKPKTTGFGHLMHILALGSILLAIGTGTIGAEYVTQQTVQALWSIKYIAFAILFEIIALHCKEYVYINNDSEEDSFYHKNIQNVKE